MRKFLVVSGFLGAGKTTVMIALWKHLRQRGIKSAIIANDLGAKDLVDLKFSRASGCDATELTGECICYQTENLVDRLRRLYNTEQNELVMSDIPGCGVGALDHVYHKLTRDYPGEFPLSPFLVVADPERLQTLLPERRDIHLPREIERLFYYQLMEADVIALNKIDTISPEQRVRLQTFLEGLCPNAAVVSVSARTGENIGRLAELILQGQADGKVVEIPWSELNAAEEALCWYNRQFYARVCCKDFDGNAFLRDLAETVCRYLAEGGDNVPHLKLYGEDSDGNIAKLSSVGVEYPIEFDRELPNRLEDLPVIINARAACKAPNLARIMDRSLEEAARRHNLDIYVFFTECFGMTDEGRI